jgi:myo-inositol-1(or 4)-monophosphatase
MNKTQSKQLGFAVELAREAGEIMKNSVRKELKIEVKEDKTIVTDVDKRINSMVIEAIQKEYPKHNILAEEYSPRSKNSEYTWVCDPVDGTMVFSKGIPMSVFSIALVENSISSIGVIYDPFHDKMFTGVYDNGARLNNDKISVSTEYSLQGAVIGMAAWKSAQRDIRRSYSAFIDRGASVLMLGSIAQMGALVASGELSASLHPARMPYDTAAAKVIVTEAGGRVTSLSGTSQSYDGPIEGAILSNRLLHDKLVEIVRTVSEPYQSYSDDSTDELTS